MTAVNSIVPSNAVTWSEVNQQAKRAEGLRSSEKPEQKDALFELEGTMFSRITNDPSLTAMEKYQMLRTVAGGKFSDAQNQMISSLFQEFSQAMAMLTNMVKLTHETMMNAIRNIRA